MSNTTNDIPYGVIGFDENMNITTCNDTMRNIIYGPEANICCVKGNVMDVLDHMHSNLTEEKGKMKVVIVVSENCSHHLRNGYVSSSIFTTIVDDTGMVKGGTIVLRKKDA